MRCLDVVRVIIPPRSSHAFGIPGVSDNIVIVGELYVADGVLPKFHTRAISALSSKTVFLRAWLEKKLVQWNKTGWRPKLSARQRRELGDKNANRKSSV